MEVGPRLTREVGDRLPVIFYGIFWRNFVFDSGCFLDGYGIVCGGGEQKDWLFAVECGEDVVVVGDAGGYIVCFYGVAVPDVRWGEGMVMAFGIGISGVFVG